MKKLGSRNEALYEAYWGACLTLLVCTLNLDRINRHHNLGWKSLCPIIPEVCLFSYCRDRVFIMVAIGTPFQITLRREGRGLFRVDLGTGRAAPRFISTCLGIEKTYRARFEKEVSKLDKSIKGKSTGTLSPLAQSIRDKLV